MGKFRLARTEIIKVISEQEARRLGKDVIVRGNAHCGVPPVKYFVTSYQVLDPPEPIKRPEVQKKP